MDSSTSPGVLAPSSFEEVEQLVLRLYQPGPPQLIHQIEKQLRDLQLSAEGWRIADFLLGRDENSVRFFGALTFQIKLNNNQDSLDDQELASLGERLIQWIITSLGRGHNDLALRKLCSTFAVYCMSVRPVQAEICVKRLVFSLLDGNPASTNSIKGLAPNSLISAIQKLEYSRLATMLRFLVDMTEEGTHKITGYPVQVVANTLINMQSNLNDAVDIIKHCLTVENELAVGRDPEDFRFQALSALAAWAFFSQKAWPGNDDNLVALRSLIEPTITICLTVDTSDTVDVLSDLLTNFGTFFKNSHCEMISHMITGPWGEEQMQEVLIESNEDVPAFVKLLLAYGDVNVKNLVTKPDSLEFQQIMTMMHNLLKCPGYAAIEDRVVVEALEFWNSFVEFVVDSEFEEEDTPRTWLNTARTHIMHAFQEIWAKVRFPPPEDFVRLDSDKQKEFRVFRVDTKELLLSAYPTLKTVMTEAIAHLCLESLSRQSWLEVEASLFCLNAIAIAEQESEDKILAELFGSQLYVQLKQPESPIPARTRRTAVDLLGQYAEFFERHTEFLPAALEFLFASLESAALAQQAAKSILSLCSSCRSSLTAQLSNFAQAYEQFLSWPTADQSTKERVIGGVAAIIQALPSPDDQANWLNALLQFISRDIEDAAAKLHSRQLEEGQVSALTAMRCLAGVAKASQAPDDLEGDLDQDGSAPDFWHSGSGQAVQTHICDAIRMVMQLFSQSQEPLEQHGEVIETICAIFRAGFSESAPGPFVLPAQVIVEFFVTTQLNTPRLDVVLTMACAFLRSHSMPSSPRIDTEVGLLLQHLIQIIHTIDDPRNEAEVSSNIIDVLTRFMPRYVNVLLQVPSQENLERLFGFPLDCLTVPEYLPKRSAAQFWAAFFTLKPHTSSVSQEHLDEVLIHFGPRLAAALIHQVAGNATRTDLDWYAEPLKAFCTRHVQTKKWLEAALMANDFPAQVGSDVRRRFLKQLSIANTIAAAKRVITAFWTQCKGLSGTYVP